VSGRNIAAGYYNGFQSAIDAVVDLFPADQEGT
jgi:hypothetical protein